MKIDQIIKHLEHLKEYEDEREALYATRNSHRWIRRVLVRSLEDLGVKEVRCDYVNRALPLEDAPVDSLFFGFVNAMWGKVREDKVRAMLVKPYDILGQEAGE